MRVVEGIRSRTSGAHGAGPAERDKIPSTQNHFEGSRPLTLTLSPGGGEGNHAYRAGCLPFARASSSATRSRSSPFGTSAMKRSHAATAPA